MPFLISRPEVFYDSRVPGNFNKFEFFFLPLSTDVPRQFNSGGPGEMGKPVHIEPENKAESDRLFKINEFNLMASDRISLNRSLPDVRPRG